MDLPCPAPKGRVAHVFRHERLLAFSFKDRGVCPSCNTRRMAEVAAHLTDHVFPWLPVRQWVLPVPKRLRPYLHYKPHVASGVLHIFLRAIRCTLQATSPGAPKSVQDVQLGAVSLPTPKAWASERRDWRRYQGVETWEGGGATAPRLPLVRSAAMSHSLLLSAAPPFPVPPAPPGVRYEQAKPPCPTPDPAGRVGVLRLRFGWRTPHVPG
jgi:hypothetical protein